MPSLRHVCLRLRKLFFYRLFSLFRGCILESLEIVVSCPHLISDAFQVSSCALISHNQFSIMPLPSRPKLLPVPAPLGAVRESFPSYGSRLSKAILDDPAIYFHSFSLRFSRNISFAKEFFLILAQIKSEKVKSFLNVCDLCFLERKFETTFF